MIIETMNGAFKKNNSAFALIELLVVIAIIGIMATVVFVNYASFNNRFALERSANNLAQEARRALERSMSSEIPEGSDPNFRGGYGVVFQEGASYYTIFRDIDNNGQYNSGADETVEDVSFESMVISEKVELFGLPGCNQNFKSVVFLSPNPFVYVGGKDSDQSRCDEIRITLSHNLLPEKKKIITINRVGLIEINENVSSTPTTCGNYCMNNSYLGGVCRQNAQQCLNNSETYESGGNGYCPGPPQTHCCCW